MSLPLYHKKNKFVSGFLLLTNLLYENEGDVGGVILRRE